MDVVEGEQAGERRADDEGDAPAPDRVGRPGPVEREQVEHQHGDEVDADVGGREAGDDQPADEAALVLLRILDGQRHGPRVAAAEEDAVEEAQQHQQDVRGQAERLVAWQQPDQQRDHAEARHRVDRGGATPDLVGDQTEDQGANRTTEKRGDEDQRRQHRLHLGREVLRLEQEHHRRQRHHRQINVEHVDVFGEEGAADGASTLLLERLGRCRWHPRRVRCQCCRRDRHGVLLPVGVPRISSSASGFGRRILLRGGPLDQRSPQCSFSQSAIAVEAVRKAARAAGAPQ